MVVSGKMAERFRAARARPSSWTRSCSRMRWSRSDVGESLRVMAFWLAASSSQAACSRPRVRRTSSRDSFVATSSVAIGGIDVGWAGVGDFECFGGFEEGIVGLQGVGLDDDFVGRGVAGNDGLGWLAETARKAALIDECPDVADAEGASGERALHAVGDVGLAVERDEPLKLLDFAFEIDATPSDFLQVDAGFWGERSEPIAPTRAVCGRAPLEH